MTSRSDIPEAAVEAAAREVALCKLHGKWWSAYEWDSGVMDERYKKPFYDAARAALEAAAPHMLAPRACDPQENVPLDGLEFQPACVGCGEVLVHDYYCGELVYRHTRPTP